MVLSKVLTDIIFYYNRVIQFFNCKAKAIINQLFIFISYLPNIINIIFTVIDIIIIIQRIFKCWALRTLQFLFGDCRSFYFHSLIKLSFLVSKGLLCLYDKQNNIWSLVDKKFLFSCSTRHLTRSLRSLVSYRVKHLKRNSIST